MLRAELEGLRDEQNRLRRLVYIDPATGIENRRAFDAALEREWALARRSGVESFVVVADLDSFKEFNDRHGHLAGDRVLRRFARTLKRTVRRSDLVARLGGDEFGLILVRCEPVAVDAVYDRLVTAMAEHDELSRLTVTIGHAGLRGAESPAGALHEADLGMLARKAGVISLSDRRRRRS